MIWGHLDGVTVPATEAGIVGRLPGVKAMTGMAGLAMITAAAGPADVTVRERGVRRRLGRVPQHAGAVRLPGRINGGAKALRIDGAITDGGEMFCML